LDLLTKTIDLGYPITSWENRLKLIPKEYHLEKWKVIISKLMIEQSLSEEKLKEVDDFLAHFAN